MTLLELVKDKKAYFRTVDTFEDDIKGLEFRECYDGHLWFLDSSGRDVAFNVEEYRNSDPPFCLWYETDDGFEFPVPLDDMKGGRFKAVEKAITLMRWIRPVFEAQREH